MAAETVACQAGQLVINMTGGAKDCGMNSIQSKLTGLEMVKLRIGPGNIIVATDAGCRESESNVGRIGRGIESRCVAVIAVRIGIGIPLLMANSAADFRMPTMQWECFRMIRK